jgi:hypothetical protein
LEVTDDKSTSAGKSDKHADLLKLFKEVPLPLDCRRDTTRDKHADLLKLFKEVPLPRRRDTSTSST